MDTRRHYNSNGGEAEVSIDQSAFPGLVVLGIGAALVIIGVILLPAVGLPNNVSEKPATVVGPIFLGLGGVLTVIGAAVAYTLKKRGDKARRKKRAQKREEERQAQEAQAERARAAHHHHHQQTQQHARGGGGRPSVHHQHHHQQSHHPNAVPATGPAFNSRVAPEQHHQPQQPLQQGGYDEGYDQQEGYDQGYGDQEYDQQYDQQQQQQYDEQYEQPSNGYDVQTQNAQGQASRTRYAHQNDFYQPD